MKKLRFYRRRLGLSGLRFLYFNLDPTYFVTEAFAEEIPDEVGSANEPSAVSCCSSRFPGGSLVARKGLT